MDFLPVKNSTCITLHCSGYIAACLADQTCNANLQCSSGCDKGDDVCDMTCSFSYPTPRFDNLLNCLYVDPGCITLPPPSSPYNNATCRDPTSTVEAVDENLLNGQWYILQGYNPLYDCFSCQQSTFEITDGKIDYSALYTVIAANGTEIWSTASMTGDSRITPGHLILDGHDNGLPDHQDWNVMHLSEDTLVVYYCGNVLD